MAMKTSHQDKDTKSMIQNNHHILQLQFVSHPFTDPNPYYLTPPPPSSHVYNFMLRLEVGWRRSEETSMEGGKEIVGLSDPENESVDEDEQVSEEESSCSTSSSLSGPLSEFSNLMVNLPIKRGLSRYYDGKSQSFTCLGRATSLEDLIKKDHSPYKKKMRSCKSYAANIGSDPRHHRLKAMIAKKGFTVSSPLPSPTGKRLMTSTGITICSGGTQKKLEIEIKPAVFFS